MRRITPLTHDAKKGPAMRTQMITAFCVLSLATCAVAANRTTRLHPNDAAALKAARIDVSFRILNAKDYAFEISSGIPEGFRSLDASLWVRNDNGLVTYSSWSSSEGKEGKCTAVFMVGEQALKDAWFTVQSYQGDKLAPFVPIVKYVLKLSEFAVERGAALPTEDFEITTPIKRDLSNTKITDAGLEHLKGLTSLQTLYLTNTQVTDAGLVHLKGLTSLQGLNLYGTRVTDAGLVHLKGMTRLKTLNLDLTQVTDAGLVHLKGMTSLKTLSLYLPQVTDAGLVHLKGLTKLQVLNLSRTQVTNAGLVHLKGLPNLKRLDLAYTRITDAGLVHVEGLSSLETLGLGYTGITDGGLELLFGLMKLQTLYLTNTKATGAGVKALRTALPKCNIDIAG